METHSGHREEQGIPYGSTQLPSECPEVTLVTLGASNSQVNVLKSPWLHWEQGHNELIQKGKVYLII